MAARSRQGPPYSLCAYQIGLFDLLVAGPPLDGIGEHFVPVGNLEKLPACAGILDCGRFPPHQPRSLPITLHAHLIVSTHVVLLPPEADMTTINLD